MVHWSDANCDEGWRGEAEVCGALEEANTACLFCVEAETTQTSEYEAEADMKDA